MKKIILATTSLLPLIGLAHPGHGETEGFSIIHYFAEPMHSAVTLGAIVVLYAGYRYFRRKNQKTR